jgi:hypothetical protein
MRFLLVILFSMPLWALSNAVTIQEKSGTTQTNRVVTIPRFFADKEVCLNPRPYSGGSPVAYWQTNVKSRWPSDASCVGGYVKFALITVEIPSLNGNGAVAVEFRGDASPSSAFSPRGKQDYLNFNTGSGAGSWGARITTGVGGLTDSVSARDMIGDDQYQVLEDGPLRTTLLVREGPEAVSGATTRTTSFGYQCTANCVGPYATSTWIHNPDYNSIRPSFVVTFYSPHTGAGSVEVDYLLDNAWMDRAQDQRLESVAIYNGAGEKNACYTSPAAFSLSFRSRMFETCWDVAPPAINIDFNRAYVTYSKVTPAYGLDYTIGQSGISAEVADFNASDQGATVKPANAPDMGWGQQTDRGGSTGGSSPIIGWVSRWNTRYLESFDYALVPVVLGNAKALMHAPYLYLENNSTSVYHDGDTAKAFGRMVSIDARRMWGSSTTTSPASPDAARSPHGDIVNTACAAPNCMVTCVAGGVISCNVYVYGVKNGGSVWGMDQAHSNNEFFVSYLFTGKRVYLEGLWTMATLSMAYGYPDDPIPATQYYGRWGRRGIQIDPYQTPRGTAWGLRNIGMAAVLSDDGSVEKAYFQEKLDYNLEAHEGRFAITNGHFPPSNSSCAGFSRTAETSIWRMYRCWGESNWSNPLYFPIRHYVGLYGAAGSYSSMAANGNGMFTEMYWVTVLAWLRGVGEKATYIHQAAAINAMHLFADPARTGGNPAFSFTQGQGESNGTDTNYLQRWADVKAAYIDSAPLSTDIGPTDTIIQLPTVGDLQTNNLELGWKAGTYWKIDDEIVFSPASDVSRYKVVSAVDAALDRLTTSTAHGYLNGQLVRVWTNGTLDSGIIGNSHCLPFLAGGALDNNCNLWVKVIDTTTVELYDDAALTNKIDLKGDGSMYLYTGTLGATPPYALIRGALGTTAAPHSQGALAVLHPIVPDALEDSDPSGGHGYYYVSGLASAVDYDVTTPAEGTGKIITARRAFDLVDQTVRNQNMLGSNIGNCASARLSLINCDNPQWAIRPRPLVRKVHVFPTAAAVKLYYIAPDGNACKVGLSTTPFVSTDDAGDTLDGQSNPARMYQAAGLTSGTTFYYRITCGPLGGAGRVNGTVRTSRGIQ